MAEVNLQKYSKALLEISQEQGQLEEVLQEVNELIKVFTSSELTSFFKSEVYSYEAKSELIDQIKQSLSKIMSNFLSTIQVNKRLPWLAEILQDVKDEADKLFKIADVEIVTSVALTNEQMQKMSHLAQTKLDLNEVNIINTIDETVIGGFVMQSRGKIIDASIRKQLAKIAQEIR